VLTMKCCRPARNILHLLASVLSLVGFVMSKRTATVMYLNVHNFNDTLNLAILYNDEISAYKI